MLAGERVLLTDFGIALQHNDTVLTADDVLVGTPEYMAPERADGTAERTAGDLFSLGATLYHALEGVSPFRRDAAARCGPCPERRDWSTLRRFSLSPAAASTSYGRCSETGSSTTTTSSVTQPG
ncbi:hypothetical protein KBZ21_19410 [Streptomyces sp. A73]|nr:hypothetical protein [Streptomyces sp. A73]